MRPARVSDQVLRGDSLLRRDRGCQSSNTVRVTRHRREFAKMLAMSLPREPAKFEVGTVAKPATLTGSPDVLRNVLSARRGFARHVESPNARSVIVSSADRHGRPLLKERDPRAARVIGRDRRRELPAFAVVGMESRRCGVLDGLRGRIHAERGPEFYGITLRGRC